LDTLNESYDKHIRSGFLDLKRVKSLIDKIVGRFILRLFDGRGKAQGVAPVSSTNPDRLARVNLPDDEHPVDWQGLNNKWYIVPNPFPWNGFNFVVAIDKPESKQELDEYSLADMIELCRQTGLVITFSGIRGGASQLDHTHVQTMETVPPIESFETETVKEIGSVRISLAKNYPSVDQARPVTRCSC
jgi:hypothetical protein